MKRTSFTSRVRAEGDHEHHLAQQRAIISITSPPDRRSRPAKLDLAAWGDVLRLEFHDSDPEKLSKKRRRERVLFSQKDAVEVLRFIKANEHRDELVVHCEAGISRSAAVSKFIASIFHVSFPQGYSLYNKHVFRVLWETFNRSLYDGEPLTKAELPGRHEELS